MITRSEKKTIWLRSFFISALLLLIILADVLIPGINLPAFFSEITSWVIIAIFLTEAIFGNTKYLVSIKLIKDEIHVIHADSLAYTHGETLYVEHIAHVRLKKRMGILRPYPILILGGPGLLKKYAVFRDELSDIIKQLEMKVKETGFKSN